MLILFYFRKNCESYRIDMTLKRELLTPFTLVKIVLHYFILGNVHKINLRQGSKETDKQFTSDIPT